MGELLRNGTMVEAAKRIKTFPDLESLLDYQASVEIEEGCT
jgi:hypothetical protein